HRLPPRSYSVVVTHRILPAEAGTLRSLRATSTGSSELDFEFVKTAMETWPW
ncbi:hypothetical protein BKA82DRAFT_3987454, partial [Pisolithus tinctorius]